MGILIFLIITIVEVVLAVFSIRTKAKQRKIRSIARLVEGIIFFIFTILSVIKWGMNYYALAIFLLIMAIMAVVTLIRNKEERTSYKIKTIILGTIGMIIIIFIVSLPAIIFPQYEMIKPTGKYSVATKISTYIDTKRVETYVNTGENRKLNVQFWYPKGDDKFETKGSY